jgi:Mitochondrial carrier protein
MAAERAQSTSTEKRLLEGLTRWTIAAFAASVAEVTTMPLDTIKVRMQLAGEHDHTGRVHFRPQGLFRTGRDILTHEGVRAFYAGTTAAVIRQAVYGGIGVGFYEPVRRLILGSQDPKTAPLG